MKFFHISDLHIGKQMHFYDLRENQRHILRQIVHHAKYCIPDVVLICGDIFDKSIPSGDAYTIFDEFLNDLTKAVPGLPVLIIGGNHDSPRRLSYAKSFLESHNIYVSALPPEEGEQLKRVTLKDEWGEVDFYMLPFIKPGFVRHLFEAGIITDYESAVRAILAREQVDTNRRNVILSHQFYTNGGEQPRTCDSEQAVLQVGGLDKVDISALEDFDYAALGHIHGAQQVREPRFRYCGTPLKYSVSEEKSQKSITLVTLEEKGAPLKLESIPLSPLQDVRREEGLLADILARATEENRRDFLSVILRDEQEPYHPMEQLEEKYDFLLELRVDNERTRSAAAGDEGSPLDSSPIEVFRSFYEEMRGRPMSAQEEELIGRILGSPEEETHE